MRRTAILTAATVLLAAVAYPATAADPAGVIRVDQVGYAPTEPKSGYFLTTAATAPRFQLIDERGRVVHRGEAGVETGGWSEAYPHVWALDFSGWQRPGTYQLQIGQSRSPKFRIASRSALFESLVRDTVHFFQVQRDGAGVLPGGPHNRKPSHLTDKSATVHHQPVFGGDGGDVPAEPLQPLAGAAPADVEGGWFDAGDYVKFTHATAYALSEMLYTQRLLGDRAPQSLRREASFGLSWLDKMWDAKARNLFVQVGIGTGSEEFGFLGDHDVWRLPEADDALDTTASPESRYLKHRPVFPAGPAGAQISPNLAGRGSAAFALAAQLAAKNGDRAAARRWFEEALSLYRSAKTTDVGELVTAFPHAYYPEDSWQDDMEFGATELALAALALGDLRGIRLLYEAITWAEAYVDSEHLDTLNLYDTSALAHADLATLLPGTDISRTVLADLRRQLDSGVASAAEHPLRHAADVTGFDAATRSFGFVATAELYRRLTGDNTYSRFGTQQRNFAFGANAWGTSLMIGAGTTSPLCPQHQVSNLTSPVRGAVVNGPNGAANFEWIGIPDGANACPPDAVNRFAAFDTPDARYLDDVRAWPSSEPAIDFTATAMLALALSLH